MDFLDFSAKTQEKVGKPTTPVLKNSPIDILSFEKSNLVTLKKQYINHATEHKQLYGKNFIVNICKSVNLGDIVTEVLYLLPVKEEDKELIHNPYLSKYFKKV